MPATAAGYTPSYQDRLDAKRFARAFWADRGLYASDYGCYGIRLRFLWPSRHGAIRYGELASAWLHCQIVFNRKGNWGWWRLCRVAIHEYGHHVNEPHSRNPNSIMAGSEELMRGSWWWPRHPACEYEVE